MANGGFAGSPPRKFAICKLMSNRLRTLRIEWYAPEDQAPRISLHKSFRPGRHTDDPCGMRHIPGLILTCITNEGRSARVWNAGRWKQGYCSILGKIDKTVHWLNVVRAQCWANGGSPLESGTVMNVTSYTCRWRKTNYLFVKIFWYLGGASFLHTNFGFSKYPKYTNNCF